MNSTTLSLLAAGATGDAPPFLVQIVPFLAMGLIFWFLIIRPQMKRQREHQDKIGGLKKGDKVLTGGGLVGRIVKLDDNYADIEIAQGVRVKAVKSTIADVIPPGSEHAND